MAVYTSKNESLNSENYLLKLIIVLVGLKKLIQSGAHENYKYHYNITVMCNIIIYLYTITSIAN